MVIFKKIENMTNYYAGDDGHIYSLKDDYKKLKASVQSNGRYYSITLLNNGKRSTHRVHRLICTAFNGRAPKNFVCSHIDGNWLLHAKTSAFSTSKEFASSSEFYAVAQRSGLEI